MSNQEKNSWLLPEGIEEILPPEATRLEEICRIVIDTFQSWGYQLVIPPMIEYLDSLLTGTGEDLELQTFKITDLLTGRMMGIRADTTPQVARIDAHYLKRDVPERLCYLGTVLHTKPNSHGGTRSPLQVGAELFGHSGIESDAETLCLLLCILEKIGIDNIHIDIGHVAIFNALISETDLTQQQQAELFNILQRKAIPELHEKIQQWNLAKNELLPFEKLIEFNGEVSILDEADRFFKNEKIKNYLNELKKLYEQVVSTHPKAPLFFDLADLRGYHYHTGIMFSAYVPGQGSGIAFGGRYDNVGVSFGRSRAATGFSADIKLLMKLSNKPAKEFKAIFAPSIKDETLTKKILELREQGETVINELPGQTGGAKAMGCDRTLIKHNEEWTVQSL